MDKVSDITFSKGLKFMHERCQCFISPVMEEFSVRFLAVPSIADQYLFINSGKRVVA